MTSNFNQGLARSGVALSTLALALLVGNAPTFAQDATAPAADKAKEETIVVTGSRISRRDFKSDSPISTINNAAIAAAGSPSLDRAIGQIPQFEAAQGAAQVGDVQGSVGFGGGASYSDLRGVGRNRSLVLLDGRRLMPSTPDGSIDLNTIPIALLDGAEIITGGASAAYGSDAVAGVANFKLKQRFTGIELNVQHGGSFKGDAGTTQVSGIVGGSFAEGKGHVLMDFEYAQRDTVTGSQRAFFTQPTLRFLGRPPEGIIFNGGWGVGAANAPTNAAVNAALPGAAPGTLGTYSGAVGVNTDQSLYTTAGSLCAQNYKGVGAELGVRINPACTKVGLVLGNYFAVQVPLTRYNVFAKTDYALSDHLTAYAQFNFSESSALDQTSPGSTATATAFGAQQLHIPVSNQFVQANPALLNLIASAYGVANPSLIPPNASFEYSKLLFGWGNRIQTFKYNVWQGLAGVKGDIPGTKFTFDLYASMGRSTYVSQAQNDISIAAINNILANEGVSGCTWNPLGVQSVSAACKTYAGRTNNTTDVLTSKNVEFSIEGPLFRLPGGEAKIALGADYRASKYSYQPDNLFVTGDSLLYGSDSPSAGSQNTKELFGELLLPILKDQPFARELSLDLGYRYSKYNSFSGKSTWKADLSWEMTKGIRLRGGYSVAIRAPSLSDLYVGQSTSYIVIGSGDPCDHPTANATQIKAICTAQSSAAGNANYTFSGLSVPVQSGGNSRLQPETAKTWSVGTVLSPTRGLNISVDYYNINISSAIASLTSGQILANCYGAAANPSFSASNPYCQLIARDSSTGNISLLTSGSSNVNNIKLDGVDAQIDYRFGLDALGMSHNAGTMQIGTVISYLHRYTIASNDGTAPVQYAGGITDALQTTDGENLYAHPHWKANTSLGYSNGPFSSTLHWRYIGGMVNLDGANPPIPAVSYFDLDAHYTFNKRFTLSVGVNNLTDKSPPYIPTLELRTDAATYDVIGRTWYAAIKAKF